MKIITFDIRLGNRYEYEYEMTDERYAEWVAAGHPDEWLIDNIYADIKVDSFDVEDA
jgi:hypothetical protein